MDGRARRLRATNYFGWHRQGIGASPRLLVRGRGSVVWDDHGRPLLDFASQLVAVNLGHGNRRVASAIARQARALPYAAPGFGTPARAELSRLLPTILPKGLDRFFFSSSGTEANEAAIRIARVVTGRRGIVALRPSYHGSTSAAISVSGDYRRRAAGPSSELPGTRFVPACHCYRCPLGLTFPDCGIACVEEVAKAIDRSGDIAAVLAEPIVGTNGVLVPVPGYLERLRAITQESGVLWIADEVMTGWGRTGRWFAVDHAGVVPDILTTAKGITSGYLPLGLTATSSAIFDRFRGRALPVGHTYEAHPVAVAAAVAAIGEYRRLRLVERSRREGAYLLERLRAIAPNHPSVGEVRGLGLFAAVELVRDRASREPFNDPDDQLEGRPLLADAVADRLAELGVHVLSWTSHLVLAPPLVVTRREIDRAVRALDEALVVADRRVVDRPIDPPGVGPLSRRGVRRRRAASGTGQI